MPRSRLRTLLLEPQKGARDVVGQVLSKHTDCIACTRSTRAVRLLREKGADLLLVAEGTPGRAQVLELAESAGLEMALLLHPHGELSERAYFVRVRFGAHKWATGLLSQLGRWGEVRANDVKLHERYRKLLNRIGDGLVEVDAEDRICWANAALQKSLGESALTGLRLEQVVKPADVPQLRAIRAQHAAGVVIPFPIRLASGQLVEVDPSPRYAADGTPLGYSIVFRGVRAGEDTERGRELFALYSVATVLSQSAGVEDSLDHVITRILELMELAGGGVELCGPDGQAGLSLRRGLELEPPLLGSIIRITRDAMGTGKAHVVRDLHSDEDGRLGLLREGGVRGLAVIPFQSKGELLGSMWFVSTDPGHFSREVVSLLISISVQMAVSVENARHVEARLEEEASRRVFYRDALQAVTRGKLTLCEGPDIEAVWATADNELGETLVTGGADIPQVRSMIEEALRAEGFADDRCYEMALCATEAAGNVVKHADSGRISIRANGDCVMIRVEDEGPGIHFSNLPRAVLSPGFSTAPSLGMGYSILLELADSIHLSTSDRGTCLIMEVARKAADPLEAFAGIGTDW